MGEEEDKEKAEKLAAARKRVAQMKKQKQKAGGGKAKKAAKEESAKDTSAPAEEGVTDGADEVDNETGEQPEGARAKQDELEKDLAVEAAEEVKESTIDPIPEDESVTTSTSRPGHGRQQSISLQSRLRSTSFRQSSTNAPGSPSPALKSPTSEFPPMTPDSSTITDIYRKQAARLEELEKANKRLEKQATDGESRWRKSEEELEELRESNGETTALREKAKKADAAQKEIEKLRAEISSLQRQHKSHSASNTKPLRSPSTGGAEVSVSPDPETKALLSAKDATITDMELEISNLRTQLSSQTSSCTTHGDQIAALTTQLSTAETKVRDLSNELADAKKSVNRLSEKAVKEGVERTSSDTKIRNLERDLAAAKEASGGITKKAETLEKKLEAMNKLHRESEARLQAKLVTAEKEARDLVALKKKLVTLENENSRLKDERERRRKKEATAAATGDDDGLAELEDEERRKLERRIRDLEGENFDLRRGVWKERRKELRDGGEDGDMDESTLSTAGATGAGGDDFTEVPLSGTTPSLRRFSSTTSTRTSNQPPQKHSSLATALTSSFSAFRTNASPNIYDTPDDDLLEDDDATFDESAFAAAQREEEMKKMVEHVREVKRGLKGWQGWRLDLVEGRKSLGSAGGMQGFGEVFEI